jgi:DNA polymerase I
VAFVPLRSSREGALTRYFGRKADASAEAPPTDRFKFRGIECRQRSTCEWVADVQRDLVARLDEAAQLDATRAPEAVCDRLHDAITALEAGQVDSDRLTITTQVSKPLAEYSHDTRTVAALERADDLAVDVAPGQRVSYVVVDADGQGRQRVRLACEDPDVYDAAFYRERVCRAAESVLSPLEWRRDEIDAYLADRENASVTAYGG